MLPNVVGFALASASCEVFAWRSKVVHSSPSRYKRPHGCQAMDDTHIVVKIYEHVPPVLPDVVFYQSPADSCAVVFVVCIPYRPSADSQLVISHFL